MRKILAILLICVMCASLFGCGAEKKEAMTEKPEEAAGETTGNVVPDEQMLLELAKDSYQMLNVLAKEVDSAGNDLCQAWYTGIWNGDEVVEGGAAYLAEKLTMSEDVLREGVAHVAFSETDGDWASITDQQWEELRQQDEVFARAQEKEALFDCCINVVWAGYLETGTFDFMEEDLSTIKESIQLLKEIDPENEYVAPLKAYYGEVLSYLEWCKAPDGSYKDAEAQLNTYEENYRSYRDTLEFDLGE